MNRISWYVGQYQVTKKHVFEFQKEKRDGYKKLLIK